MDSTDYGTRLRGFTLSSFRRNAYRANDISLETKIINVDSNHPVDVRKNTINSLILLAGWKAMNVAASVTFRDLIGRVLFSTPHPIFVPVG